MKLPSWVHFTLSTYGEHPHIALAMLLVIVAAGGAALFHLETASAPAPVPRPSASPAILHQHPARRHNPAHALAGSHSGNLLNLLEAAGTCRQGSDTSSRRVRMWTCLLSASYGPFVLRPGRWSRPAGGSPVQVDTRVPGSRPRFGAERRRGARDLAGAPAGRPGL